MQKPLGSQQTPPVVLMMNLVVQKTQGPHKPHNFQFCWTLWCRRPLELQHPKHPTYEEPLSCRKPREPQGFLTIRICTTRAHHKYNLWDLLGCPLFLHHEFSSEVNFVAWVGTPWFSATQSPPQYRSNVVCSSNSEIP